MRICLALTLFAAACTAASTDPKLPSASFTPHAQNAVDTGVACGDNVAFGGDTSPDVRYAYTYNSAGELSHAEGVFTAGGPDDSIDYGYDAAGDFTSMNEVDGSAGSTIGATYDATNGMTDYNWSYSGPGYADGWDYTMSSFIAPWQPAREVVTETGQAGFGYTLAYDADGRLTTATPDTGDATTYTYDDAAGTISVDTGNGAFTGLITYDTTAGVELSEVWGGSDPNAWASSTVYTWNGDELVGDAYSSGTQAAPQTLSLVEVDTLQYQCANARRGGHTRFTRPQSPATMSHLR